MLKVLLTALLISGSAFAQDTAKMDPKMQEAMAKMHAASTPGDEHKMLAQMAGNWSYTSKMWETADGQPMESKGTSKIKMILGGRILQHDTKSKVMGQNYEGIGFTAYDNVKKEYQTVYMDTMSTAMMTGEGKYDANTKTLTDEGEFTCPMTGKEQDYRSEWVMIDKNNMVFSMYSKGMTGKGKEFKTLEMTYKRTK